MENAAKALTIAGGVLIAIIVVATLWYSFQQWGILPQAKDDNKLTSQEIAFNKEFESYNKQNIYGTEIITVINKAIANNEKYGITAEPNSPYYVDVKITLVEDVHGYTKTYTRTKDSEKYPDPVVVREERPFLKAGTYSVERNLTQLYNLCNSDPREVKETKRGDTFTRIEKYSAEEEFRLRYFTCTGVEHDQITGRVKCINFKEVTSDLYDVE